jgi:alpha-glucosidase
MAYSFNLLTADGSAQYIRAQVEEFEARVAGGWASWSVGNHDAARVMTRWGKKGNEGDATSDFAKVVLAMQLALRGTPCIYQGDELALTEADVPYEALQDPVGITFWPDFKGRDGCRTPIPWHGKLPHAGFTTGKPWLPVPPEHAAAAVDTQEDKPDSALKFARRFLAWRKSIPQLTRGAIAFFDAPEPVLAFQRSLPDMSDIVIALNLGSRPVQFELPAASGCEMLNGHGLPGAARGTAIDLPAYGAWFGIRAR